MRVVDVGQAPDLLQQLLVGEHIAGMLREDLQQAVFLRRQRQAFFVDEDVAGREIDFQPIDPHDAVAGRGARLAPEHDLGPRQQLGHAERLGDVVVGAELEQPHFLHLARLYRQDDDGNVRP